MKNWLLFICLLATLQLAMSLTLRACVSDCKDLECKKHCVYMCEKGVLGNCLSRPVDCCDIKRNKIQNNVPLTSRVYAIYPPTDENKAVEVYCDMHTEGGGWTVFLSRDNTFNKVNFTADWNAYKNGFGTPGEEHWLGNDNLHALTKSEERKNVLRVEYFGYPLTNTTLREDIWGEWNTFKVASNAEKYNLTASNPNPQNTARNVIFSRHNGMKFTTFDEDNDNWSGGNCAIPRKGGWWYNFCYRINPTGRNNDMTRSGLRVDYWSKQLPEYGIPERLQLKMRPTDCN